MDKIKLTKEQLKTLNDVFNYALNFMEEQYEGKVLLKQDENGKFYEYKFEDFEKEVLDLAEVLKKYIDMDKPKGE